MKLSHAAVAFVLLCTAAVAADAQTVTLRYKWAKGESRTYRVTNQTDSTITGMPNGTMNVSQTMTQVLKYTADEVARGRQRHAAPDLSVGPDGEQRADGQDRRRQRRRRHLRQSDRAERAPGDDGDDRRVGHHRDGRPTARCARSTARRASPTRSPARLPRPIRRSAAAGQGLRNQSERRRAQDTLEQTFPRDVRAAGQGRRHLERASSRWAIAVIGRITGRSTFTLKAIEGTPDAPLARIAVVLALKQDGVPPPSGPSGMVMTLGDAKGEGEILFRRHAGDRFSAARCAPICRPR